MNGTMSRKVFGLALRQTFSGYSYSRQASRKAHIYHLGTGNSMTRLKNPLYSVICRDFGSSTTTSVQSQQQSEEPQHKTEAITSKNASIFKTDFKKLEASIPPSPPRIKGRTLIDIWAEAMTRIASESPSNSAALIDADIDWMGLLKICNEIDRVITKTNFGGIIMNICLKYNNLPLAENYLHWDVNPSLATLTLYMRLCVEHFESATTAKTGGVVIEEEKLLRIYEKVKAKNKNVWDIDSGERIIIGLCKTRLWRDSFSILESMQVGGRPTPVCYSSVAAAAFENGEMELGWKILTEQADRVIFDEPFVAWLENCEPNEENVKKLLEFMDLHEQYGGEKLVTGIKSYFEKKLGYVAKDTDIVFDNKSSSGVAYCYACASSIKSSELTTNEFNSLQDNFLNRVLISNDLFYNTTPKELEDFKKFVEDTGPYDYVLDGLNVAFSRGTMGNPAGVLREVVLHLNRLRKKTLVIGRHHMTNWPVKMINHIRRMSRFYCINNESEDDPFMIWATLKSGPSAKFVSRDLLRNHAFRLQDPEMARLFKRWRLSSQMGVGVDYKGHVKLEPFCQIFPVPQKEPKTGYWHIPYQMDSTSPYDIPKKWICLEPKRK